MDRVTKRTGKKKSQKPTNYIFTKTSKEEKYANSRSLSKSCRVMGWVRDRAVKSGSQEPQPPGGCERGKGRQERAPGGRAGRPCWHPSYTETSERGSGHPRGQRPTGPRRLLSQPGLGAPERCHKLGRPAAALSSRGPARVLTQLLRHKRPTRTHSFATDEGSGSSLPVSPQPVRTVNTDRKP